MTLEPHVKLNSTTFRLPISNMSENNEHIQNSASSANNGSYDAFKEVFKYYKRKSPPPDLSSVIDFCEETRLHHQGVTQVSLEIEKTSDDTFTELLSECGLKPSHCWNVYQINAHPGVDYWMEQCFNHYWRHPNQNNLTAVTVDESQLCQIIEKKLRWATLGYHHNWDSKEYSEDFKGTVPTDLSKLSNYVANCLGFPGFRAEAAIVNYYALDSTLGGHTDHSERNYSAPLLSFSFGQSAIFLLGGKDKTVKPSAIRIRNGDVLVMSGPSRLCYHAIPKILQDSHWCDFENGDACREGVEKWWWPLATKMRLNMNVRQVYD